MQHHQPQLFITGCCSHTKQQRLGDRRAKWRSREMAKAWNWVLKCFLLKLLFTSCKDSISLFVFFPLIPFFPPINKSNRCSRGGKRPALPLKDTQKHESICILTQHTHTLLKQPRAPRRLSKGWHTLLLGNWVWPLQLTALSFNTVC